MDSQISLNRVVVHVERISEDRVVALCDDGTMWVSDVRRGAKTRWYRVTDVPQEDENENS